jgi:hypothetical protein
MSSASDIGSIAASPRGRMAHGWFVALALLAAAAPARSDWSDDFDGGFEAPWSYAATDDAGATPATGTTTFAVVEAGADDYLLMAHSTRALRDGGGGAADAFAWVDEVFANLAVSADVNAGPAYGRQNLLAVAGRGDPETGATYLAGVDFANGRFLIARSDDFLDPQTPLVASLVALDPLRTYRIHFYLIGSSLTARLFDAATGSLLSTLHVDDTRFAAGVAGLLVETGYDASGNPVAPIVGTFDDVKVVPEPLGRALAWTGVFAFALLAGLSARRAALDAGP